MRSVIFTIKLLLLYSKQTSSCFTSTKSVLAYPFIITLEAANTQKCDGNILKSRKLNTSLSSSCLSRVQHHNTIK